jgi:hypothetical protein
MTPSSPTAAPRVADPGLFARLVDDAAVFPPGNAPLDDAVRLHRFHRASAYAVMVGPLLVPVSSAMQLEEIAARSAGALTPDLEVALVARPGVPTAQVEAAVRVLDAAGKVTVVGVEMAWSPQWRAAVLDGPAVTLEVPRGQAQLTALDDLRDQVAAQAKFRTGATPTWDWPDEEALASFIRAAVARDVPFKLTGGLHHLVRATHEEGEQHGLLNVVLAVHLAVTGATGAAVTTVLAERDTDTVVQRTGLIGPDEARAVRRAFTAYGCCEVTDPIGELMTRRLIQGA